MSSASSSPEPPPSESSMKSSSPKSSSNSTSAQNGGVVSVPSPRAKRTPSPSVPSPMELPLGSGIRQLAKLKRFLTTLLQFGRDVSPETGDKVHGLILALVNSNLTVEEFHQKIQDVTNYPLRPFVIPFLKAHLPLLQSELLYFSRLAKQSPQQYLRQHEQLILDPMLHPGGEPFEFFQNDTKENGKRRTPPDTRPRENGYDDSLLPPAKRHQSLPSPTLGARLGGHLTGSLRYEENTMLYRERDRYERYERTLHRDFPDEHDTEDEWKNINTMLNCILGMVEKTKRALAILQHRSQLERPAASSDFIAWSRSRHLDGTEYDIKKRSSEMLVHYKSTEDRVLDVRRRADAVNEVKRQAVVELQKAVSAAESKASELVAAERAKMERLIGEARRQATEEAFASLGHQEESTENCWNCGRKASETCSGCNSARYCGAFCQRKDWEIHHKHCQGRLQSSSTPPSHGGTLAPILAPPVVDAKPLLLPNAGSVKH